MSVDAYPINHHRAPLAFCRCILLRLDYPVPPQILEVDVKILVRVLKITQVATYLADQA